MLGKNKCKALKEIRRKIAEENDIEYVTEECVYKGECKGTCPKCEAELRYIEEELEKRKKLGKNIAVIGISAAMISSLVGCDVGNKNVPDTSSSTSSQLQIEGAMEELPPQEIISETTTEIKDCTTEENYGEDKPFQNDNYEITGEVAPVKEYELEGDVVDINQ